MYASEKGCVCERERERERRRKKGRGKGMKEPHNRLNRLSTNLAWENRFPQWVHLKG